MTRRVGLVTYYKQPALTEDDRPLVQDFAALGVSGAPVRWDDHSVKWQELDALILRSCWDYHERHEEFERWLADVERAGVPMFNPVPLVRWNMNKRYLRELEEHGIRVPETVWLERGDDRRMTDILAAHDWSDAIVKPAISASATDTWRTGAASAREQEGRFRQLLDRSAVLVQRFVPEVASRGEWSLIYIAGAFSHALLKRPRAGDFRVQTEHGGSAEALTAPAAVLAEAERVTHALPAGWLFARIDGVETPDGFTLMEAECIEPHLFFEMRPAARRELALAVAKRLELPSSH